MAKVGLSVLIVACDEEDNIRNCLESVKWADEIIVVDSGSTDRTCEIAKEYTDKVVYRKWEGFIKQKNFVLSLATKEWIFNLDADERCTPDLAREIQRVINSNDADGFFVKRHAYYLSRWINHCGWYPDYKLRLAKRTKCIFAGEEPHDQLVVDGTTRKLNLEIQHYTYKNFAHQLRTINAYSDTASEVWTKKGKKPSLLGMLLYPPIKFFEVYLYKLGFLDGLAGFTIAVATSFYVFTKYVKLWEAGQKQHQCSKGSMQGQKTRV